jgi:hypothetical protein
MADSTGPTSGQGGVAAASGARRDQEPTTVILRRLADNLGKFVDTYSELAAEEVRRTKRDAIAAAVLLGAGAGLAFFALALGITAAVLALSLAVAPWLAALILCVLSGLVAGVLAILGMKRLRFQRLTTLMRSVMEDVRWMRRELLGSV